MASKCKTAFVEPPSAITTTIAFSKRFSRHDIQRTDILFQKIQNRFTGIHAILRFFFEDRSLRR